MIFKDIFGSESWHKLRELKRPQPAALGGVCVGLGEATPFATWMWRAFFLVATVAWGFGILAYIILWISIPSKSQ
jgi:phage shock protein PspC (stress-responsive transcriptional regulator)